MSLEATPLERRLLARIRQAGAVPFKEFMQAALYDEEFGYYNTRRPKIGPGGDYYTSSNVHPAFGAILARAFVKMWSGLEPKSSSLEITEVGAGTGQLAFDVLSALRDEYASLFDAVLYTITETSAAMRARQQEKLSGFGSRVRWRGLDELEVGTVIAFSNELVDAFPVHAVRMQRGRLEELYVGEGGRGRLAPEWREPSEPRIVEYIGRLGIEIAEGQVIEINLAAIDWIERMARIIARGFLVTIDYGDVSAHLYGADRRAGTLRSFYRHRLVESPLERPGEQDITASVNFTALMEYGRDLGLETVSYERQTAFLMRLGLIERIAAMESAGSLSLAGLKERLALKNLFAPGGVSDNFRVLIQAKR